MVHRIPHDRLLKARRRCQKLGSRAEVLEHASSSSIVVGLYGVALAYAMTRELLPWLIAVAPFPLAAGLAIRARRLRKRLDAHERRMGRLVQGSDSPQPAAGQQAQRGSWPRSGTRRSRCRRAVTGSPRRRAPGDPGPERVEVGGKPASPSRSVAAERAASQDLLEIDRFVRRRYAALASSGVGGWWQRGSRPGDEKPGLDGFATEQPVGFRERSRTVHVIADVAVVISTSEVESGSERSTAVNALQRRRSRSGWLLRELLSRSPVLAVAERTADPRPPSATPSCIQRWKREGGR